MNKSFFEKLAGVRVKDLLSLILCLAAWPLSLWCRARRPHIWLVCEYGPEARDNGYWLYRYLRLEHPEIDAVYAVNRDSVDRERVTALGPVVDYGSLRHWILYLAAEVNISSQKGGKPNAAVCYLLEVVTGILKNRRVFLQHGIIKDDLPFLHREKTNLSMFVTSTQREFDFVNGTFGYDPGVVVLTGLARYDNLVDSCTLIKSIGKQAHMVEGNRGNIKVTTPEDVYMYRALIQYRENEQAFGIGLTPNNILRDK